MLVTWFQRSRVGRALLLGVTVVATVATSPASLPRLFGETPEEELTLAPNEAIDRTVELEASHDIQVIETGASAKSPSVRALLHIEQHERRPGCSSDRERGIQTWETATGPVENIPREKTLTFGGSIYSDCRTGTKATVALRFVNQGPEPLTFSWATKSYIDGDPNEDEMPDGAFIDVRRTQ